MTKEDNQKEINRLAIDMIDLCVKSAKIAIKPKSKYKATNDRRMAKIIAITFHIGTLKAQMLIVKSQGKEIIVNKDGNLLNMISQKYINSAFEKIDKEMRI